MRGTIDGEHEATFFLPVLCLRNLPTGTDYALTGLAAAASHGGLLALAAPFGTGKVFG